MTKKTHRGYRGTRKAKRSKSRPRSKSTSPTKRNEFDIHFMMNLSPMAHLPPGVRPHYPAGLQLNEPLRIETSPEVQVVPAYSPSLSPNAEEWFPPPPPKSSPPLLSAKAPIVDLSAFALAPMPSPRAMRPYSVPSRKIRLPPPELLLNLLDQGTRIYWEQYPNIEDQIALRDFFDFYKTEQDLHLWTTGPHPYMYKGRKHNRVTRNNGPPSAFRSSRK